MEKISRRSFLKATSAAVVVTPAYTASALAEDTASHPLQVYGFFNLEEQPFIVAAVDRLVGA